MDFNKINYYISLALDEAYTAEKYGEVPVGAVLVDQSGKILSKTHNTKEYENNPCHHAEILAIMEASQELRSWRLSECELYITLEPCPMCLGAIIQSRLKKVFFGAYDLKGGAVSLGLNLHQNKKLNHRVSMSGGFKHLECSRQLSNFFRRKRSFHKINS